MTQIVSGSNLWPFRWGRIGMRLSATGESATELSVTDAWADAAAGDVKASHIPGDVVCTVADRRGKLGEHLGTIMPRARAIHSE
jgi:hypothetical protein